MLNVRQVGNHLNMCILTRRQRVQVASVERTPGQQEQQQQRTKACLPCPAHDVQGKSCDK